MNKQEFKLKANQTIDEISAKINKLKADKNSTQDDVKNEIEKNIKNLELKESELKVRLPKLEKASDKEWENAKEAFSKARENYNEALHKIESRLEKII